MNIKKCVFWLILFLIPVLLIFLIELTARFYYGQNSLLTNLIPCNTNSKYFFLYSDKWEWVGREKKNLLVPFKQDEKTFTIVCFGGSTTFGTPFPVVLSFPRFLQHILTYQYPSVNFLVINMGFFAQIYDFAYEAASHSIKLNPDYFVIYSGHNELYPHNLQITINNNKLLPNIKKWLMKHSCAFSAANYKLQEFRKEKSPENTADLKWQNYIEDAVSNYKNVTYKFKSIAERYDISLLFITPLRNLADYPPDPALDSMTNISEQTSSYLQNKKTRTPSESFQVARFLDKRGQYRSAKKYYEEASDGSVSRGARTHSRIISFIRSLSGKYSQISVLDMESKIEQNLPKGIIGDETLVDWCHPTLETHYEIAVAISEKLIPALKVKYGLPENNVLSFEQLRNQVPNFKRVEVIGIEEGGFFNIQFKRYKQAKLFFEERLNYNYSLKSALGLGICFIYLKETNEAKNIARLISAKSNQREIESAISEFYNPERDKIRKLFSL
jgi:hypothetical protein